MCDERRDQPYRSDSFDYAIDFDATDFRAHPELYRIGRGEQGVLSVEPYKSEILPHWRFKTPAIAEESSAVIFAMFEAFRDAGDGVGMDMARKFLQMGWTRARRYANHRGGRKYHPVTGEQLPYDVDPVKAEAAAVFKHRYERAKADPVYRAWVAEQRLRERAVRPAEVGDPINDGSKEPALRCRTRRRGA
jgi:hypothetical protein